MKKYSLIILLILCATVLCSCKTRQSEKTMNSSLETASKTEDVSTAAMSEASENKETNETPKKPPQPQEITENISKNSKPENTRAEAENKSQQSKETETTQTEEKTVTSETATPTSGEVAEKIVYYINRYREAQGAEKLTVLPIMTKVAEYRSKQLITNFAHSTKDIREATAYYKYGKYVDMTSFGFDETYNYYDYGGMEAIAKGGWSGTADQIGKQITEIIKESDNHWRYVGSNDYRYIAVGAAYNADTDCKWYACIIVSATNEYE